MTLRNSGALSLGAFFLLAPSAMAAEEFAKGMAVAREVVSHEGHRFLFTVTPPADRGVDPRTFDLFEVENRAEKGVGGVTGMPPKEKDAERDDAETLDLSGYSVRIEQVKASAATTCTLSVPFVRFNKAKLSGRHYFRAVAPGAAAMVVSSYGTLGDVDAAVFRGPEFTTLCSFSTKGPGQFDLAKCNEGSCNAAGEVLTGIIINQTSRDAEFVGGITVTFAQ